MFAKENIEVDIVSFCYVHGYYWLRLPAKLNKKKQPFSQTRMEKLCL